MIYTCRACSRVLVTRGTEALEDGTFPEVVSYAAVVKPWEDEGERGTVAYCCADCAEPTRGKFEGNHGRHASGTARVLYALALEGLSDDEMGEEDHCNLIGRYLLFTDYYGFVTFEEHDTSADAQKRYDDLYTDGMGMSEFDAIISDDRGSYFVQMDGKKLGTFERFNRARAAIRLEAFKTGHYPDAWHVGERGNVDHVNY